MTVLDDPTRPPLDPPDDPVVALHAAVDALLAAPPGALPGEVALERQRAVLVEIERLRVAAVAGLRDIDTRELYLLDGAGSAAGWMRAQPVAPPGVTVSVARQLESLPVAAGEAAAGRLSLRDATAIAGALAKVPDTVEEAAVVAVLTDGIGQLLAETRGGITAEARAATAALAAVAASPRSAARRLEDGFVTLAQQTATALPAGRLPALLDLLVDALTPEAHDARDADLHAHRHLDLQPVLDGGWHVRGLLDAETGQALHDALERFTAPTSKDTDDRSSEQKRHDALRELCAFSATHADAPTTATRAGREVVVYAGKATLEHQPGALPARLPSGMPLSPATLDRLGCDALFTPLLLDEHGQPLRLGRTRRLFSKAQRTALHAQWGGRCAGDGCGNRATVIHHIVPWQLGGPTDLDHAAPLCLSTHHDVHTGHKHVRLKDGRWIGPHGFVDGPSP